MESMSSALVMEDITNRSLPHLQGVATARVQEGWEELLHIQGQEGRCEKILLIQGKEQQLRFAGAAVKRHPCPR